jgi:hypothetical protein
VLAVRIPAQPLAAIQRITGLPPCARSYETISLSSSRIGDAMEWNL